jgi:hypothetical protein
VLIRGEPGTGKTVLATQLVFFLSCLISQQSYHCIPLMVDLLNLIDELRKPSDCNWAVGDKVQVCKKGTKVGAVATVLNNVPRPSDGRILVTMDAQGGIIRSYLPRSYFRLHLKSSFFESDEILRHHATLLSASPSTLPASPSTLPAVVASYSARLRLT